MRKREKGGGEREVRSNPMSVAYVRALSSHVNIRLLSELQRLSCSAAEKLYSITQHRKCNTIDCRRGEGSILVYLVFAFLIRSEKSPVFRSPVARRTCIARRAAGIREGIRVPPAPLPPGGGGRSSAMRDGLGTSLAFRRPDTPGSLSLSLPSVGRCRHRRSLF
jgi:hypothetical protein